jgi:ADP-ribose pyrophosphatase YjhB (NUDIX family)
MDTHKMKEAAIRVGTRAVIFNADNELLVEHHRTPETDYCYLPGGGTWHREKIEDCLVREVKEETGLEVRAERLLWVRDFLEGFPDHAIEVFFLASIVGGEFKPIHDTEPIEFAFLAHKELENIVFYPKSLVQKLKLLRDDRSWSDKNPYLKSAE